MWIRTVENKLVNSDHIALIEALNAFGPGQRLPESKDIEAPDPVISGKDIVAKLVTGDKAKLVHIPHSDHLERDLDKEFERLQSTLSQERIVRDLR